MRTLVATALYNAKNKPVYCMAKKITDEHMKYIRNTAQENLEAVGFTFIKLLSLDYPNVRGYAVFFEGHVDDLLPALKSMR
ncbi:MAG: hypothetical protein ABRQ24_02340 [Syntrophomonadaceae bacterium]